MKIVKDRKELQRILEKSRINNIKIGLIPTMGSIHKGHISLINSAKKMNCFSVVTVFVNPTQFNDKKDFDAYPQNNSADISILKKTNCEILFFPKTEDLYPNGLEKQKTIFDYRDILCDKFRPGHFDGVTTVVNSLFNIIKPDTAYFGEKDFQQLKIIQKIVINNSLPIVIYPCPSVRMQNGMSYSSRYENFSLKQRKIFNDASFIINIKVNLLRKKIYSKIINNLKKEILETGVTKIDYLEIRNEKDLSRVKNKKNARLFVAFYIDQIRVIDNFVLY